MLFSRLHNRRHSNWLTRVPVAHRGLHGQGQYAPENSLRAFANAIRRGFAIELDVHASLDGEAIVFHDDTLMRMTGQDGLLAQFLTRDLVAMTLKGSDQHIPTLAQVLDLVRGQVGLLIELKTERATDDRLERRVSELLRPYRGPVAVQSFNPATIRWFARYHGDLPRGQLAYDEVRAKSKAPLRLRRRRASMDSLLRDRADFIGYHVKAMPNLALMKWRRRGVPVLAWTIRNRTDLSRARHHADNIIFEGIEP